MNFSMSLLWIFFVAFGLIALISMYIGKVLLERIRARYKVLKQEISIIHQEVGLIQQQVGLEQLSDLVRWSADEGIVDQRASQKMLKHILELKEAIGAQDTPV